MRLSVCNNNMNIVFEARVKEHLLAMFDGLNYCKSVHLIAQYASLETLFRIGDGWLR